MKNKIYSLLAACTLLLLNFGYSQELPDSESLKAIADEYLEVNPEASGVIAAIGNSGSKAWKYSKGYKGLGRDSFLTGKEAFIAASITKTFVAVCILQLEEEGKLAISDKVTRYLDEELIRRLSLYKGSSYENKITIAQLLRHTSGIFDYLNETQTHLEAYKNHPQRTYTLEDRVAIALDVGSATSRPGEYHYSNTNYILLGMILEKLESKDIGSIINQRIIVPLGLNNTSLNPEEKMMSKMLKGYYTDWDLTSFTYYFNRQNPAGGILTTVDDLLIFGNAVFSGRLFRSPLTLEKMLNFHKGYGLGVMQFEKNRKTGRVVGHSGFDPGYTCYLAYVEKPGLTVVTVINQSELRVNMPAFLVVKMVHLIKEGL
ncbi:serine hydrolase domain-containing protein [Poritiphilus flavus]|uniref:Serine hydrolase n=1 Tax=Poritiphilus flavus TaxID=2697053 RepID=A0A6L9E8G1_9FLAO|nr:serine hydrolase domain-containing protein [Poritiphilus flavus]NAS11067.1 serine hydrolase [Poritiphilus flavus]